MGSSAAALVVDGVVVAAIEEERLSRVKNDGGFPHAAIAACLDKAGLSFAELDHICVYWQPWRIGTRALATVREALGDRHRAASQFRRVANLFGGAGAPVTHPELTGRWSDLFRIKSILRRKFGPFRARVHYYDHHACHRASAYQISGFDRALSLSYDGGGEEHSTVLAYLDGRRTDILKRVEWPNSLGHFYSYFTGYLGFRMLEGEYKMMGLAPYGMPRFKDRILTDILTLEPDGAYRFNSRLANYHEALEGRFAPAVAALLCPPRPLDGSIDETHHDLAASVQAAFEAVLLHMMQWAAARYPDVRNLCVSGGCGLNVTANGRLREAGLFDRIFVPPAPHDAGCAVGAALLGASQLQPDAGFARMDHPYLGNEFDDDQIAAAFAELGLEEPRRLDATALVEECAQALADGQVIAWFQGGSEFGPRALGARSFLADPRSDAMRETLNAKIKKREPFRPFAPSVKEEAAGRFFEIHQPSPFMNIVSKVKEDQKAVIPAVTHIDGTARVHTVSRAVNPRYWDLIDRFEGLTGVGVLLNTSFNIQEPIVNTPTEAIRTFMASGVDKLAIGSFLCDAAWRRQNGALAA